MLKINGLYNETGGGQNKNEAFATEPQSTQRLTQLTTEFTEPMIGTGAQMRTNGR
jgi:hypothetical protein